MLFSNQSFKGDKKLSKSFTKDKIRKLISQDPVQVPSHIPMTGRTKYFLNKWMKITSSQRALNIVGGYKPQFLAEPFKSFQPKTFVCNQQEAKIIEEEIDTLLEKEAIEPIPHRQAKFVSNLFLVKKKSGGFRPVINLKSLNQFVHTEHFAMETITSLRTMLSKEDWIVTIDISNAYLTIPLDEEFKDYVTFRYHEQTNRFLCNMPFGLNDAARAFTKTMKQSAAKVRALGFKVLGYSDDWILAAQTRLLCLKQSRFLVTFLQKLGFRINLEKSSLAPSQIKEWLGFVIDSRSMTISLPQKKIDNLIEKAQDLKAGMRVTLREISQFLGLCNSSKPAVLQAPLHYCSIQRLLIRNLRRFLNPCQPDYLTVVTLDTPSIQDLDWWIQEMKLNCTRKICTPQPSFLISTDSSDFAWGAIQNQVKIQGLWRNSQLGWHINIKELMAAFLALQLLVPNCRNVHVQPSLDNTTAVAYLNHQGGTKSVQLSALATEMWCWCLERSIYLSAIHIPGLKNLFADPLSCLKNLSTE